MHVFLVVHRKILFCSRTRFRSRRESKVRYRARGKLLGREAAWESTKRRKS